MTPLAHAQKSKYTTSEANASVVFHSTFEESEERKEDYKTVKVQGIFDEMVYFFAYTVHDGELDDKASLEKISLESFVGGLGAQIETNEIWKLKKTLWD